MIAKMRIEFTENQSDFLRRMKLETGIPGTIFIRQLVQNAMAGNDGISSEQITTTITRTRMASTHPRGIRAHIRMN